MMGKQGLQMERRMAAGMKSSSLGNDADDKTSWVFGGFESAEVEQEDF